MFSESTVYLSGCCFFYPKKLPCRTDRSLSTHEHHVELTSFVLLRILRCFYSLRYGVVLSVRRRSRARILLLCDEAGADGGLRDGEVVRVLGVGTTTVERIRRRFVEEGTWRRMLPYASVDAVPFPQAGRRGGRRSWWCGRFRVAGRSCGVCLGIASEPAGGAVRGGLHRQRDSASDALKTISSLGRSSAGACRPGTERTDFVHRMEDVLEVYQRDFGDDAVLVCIDKTSKQQEKETRKAISCGPGSAGAVRQRVRTQRRPLPVYAVCAAAGLASCESDRTRPGAAGHPLAGPARGAGHGQLEHPPAGMFCTTLANQRKHCSWLNMAEMEISAMIGLCLNRRLPDRETPRREVDAWQERRNREAVRVDYRFTTADARIKREPLYQLIQK